MAKLVAIGDSATQGFMSAAISSTDLSFPAQLARCMGLGPGEFLTPPFHGEGGLPLNLEYLLDQLEDRYGSDFSWHEKARVLFTVRSIMDKIEDYWERGPGAQPLTTRQFHNLAVWGFEVSDAYEITPELCDKTIGSSSDNLITQVPTAPMYRTARRVLNPAQLPQLQQATQISIAKSIAYDGGIENLVLWLGNNNVLGTVLSLAMRATGDTPPPEKAPERNAKHNIWTPTAFKTVYQRLADQIDALGATRVFVGTVPHLTILPFARGFNQDGSDFPGPDGFFDNYGYFFVPEGELGSRDPKLPREKAKQIDGWIDGYNETIKEVAAQRDNWHVVDTCNVLDRLAYRRNHGNPTYPLPPELAALNPPPDARFFKLDENRNRIAGGLISLDGVHPTTIGYGIITQEFVNAFKAAGVQIDDVDFSRLLRSDTLVSDPPAAIKDVIDVLGRLEEWINLSWILGKISGE